MSEGTNTIFSKDRYGIRGKWKVGVWRNYGYDSEHPNYCASHITFLAWTEKKPTMKEVFAAFPLLRDSCVTIGPRKQRKINSSDIIFSREGDLYDKHF